MFIFKSEYTHVTHKMYRRSVDSITTPEVLVWGCYFHTILSTREATPYHCGALAVGIQLWCLLCMCNPLCFNKYMYCEQWKLSICYLAYKSSRTFSNKVSLKNKNLCFYLPYINHQESTLDHEAYSKYIYLWEGQGGTCWWPQPPYIHFRE